MYDKFLQLYRENEYKIKHGKRNHIKPEWISSVEEELSFPLPESYKWWLKKFEYFVIENTLVKYVEDPAQKQGQEDDILYAYRKGIEEGTLESNELCVLRTENALFYFLVEPNLKNNEYRVCCRDYISEDDDFYADNFLKFLEMKIYEME